MRADKRIPKSFDNAQEYSYLEYFFLNECVAQVYKELRESDKFITATKARIKLRSLERNSEGFACFNFNLGWKNEVIQIKDHDENENNSNKSTELKNSEEINKFNLKLYKNHLILVSMTEKFSVEDYSIENFKKDKKFLFMGWMQVPEENKINEYIQLKTDIDALKYSNAYCRFTES